MVACVLHVANGSHVDAQSNEKVLQAWRSGIQTTEDFGLLHDFVIGDATSQDWQKIDWFSDLTEAREEARKQGRPLFIWAMNGDPLGCV